MHIKNSTSIEKLVPEDERVNSWWYKPWIRYPHA